MANMSYCRFQSTLADLRDCEESLDENSALPESEKEKYAAIKLLQMCIRIAENHKELLK